MRQTNDIMKDAMFWSRLEFAACGWLAASAESLHRRYWIDGFAPEELRETNAGAEISGRVSIAGHRSYEEFRFYTCMPWRVANRERELFEIERIEIDEERRTVELSFRATLKKPNKALEPTPTSVTSRADARLAPAAVVAHL